MIRSRSLLLLFTAIILGLCTGLSAKAQSYWKHGDFYNANFMMNKGAAKDSMNFIAGGSGPYSAVLKTSDGGRSWQEIFSDFTRLDTTKKPPYFSQHINIYDLAYLSNGVMIVIADSTKSIKKGNSKYQRFTGVILRSDDAGKTWDRTEFGALEGDSSAYRIFNISMSDTLNGIVSRRKADSYCKDVSQLIYTTDGGKTWKDAHSPDNNDLYPQIIASPAAGVWIMYGWNFDLDQSVLWRTEDYGKTWQMVKDIPQMNSISFASPLVGYSAGQSGPQGDIIDVIAKTIDGGLTWTTVLNKLHTPPEPLRSISFCDKMNGLAAGMGGKILRTRDSGATWQQEDSELSSYSAEHLYSIMCITPRHAIATGLNGKILVYHSEGILQQPQFISPAPAGVSDNIMDRPVRTEWTAVVGAERYQLQVSTTSWFGSNKAIPGDTLYLNRIFTTTLHKIDSLPAETSFNIRVRAIAGSDTSNWSKPNGFRTSGDPVSVEYYPSVLSIGRPYPNPVQSMVFLPFEAGTEAAFDISLHDVFGKEIINYTQEYSAINNSLVLSDLQGLVNGIYFARIQQGELTKTFVFSVLH